jgi:hypothetical protein
MAGRVVETALVGNPDMTSDPAVQSRKNHLLAEARLLLNAIRELGGGVDDPLSDPTTLARAVRVGLLDAPQLVNNRYAPGRIRTRSIDGAIQAVDAAGEPLSEERRISHIRSSQAWLAVG